MRETYAPIRREPCSGAVGTARAHCLADLQQLGFIDRRCAVAVREYSCDPAHGYLPSESAFHGFGSVAYTQINGGGKMITLLIEQRALRTAKPVFGGPSPVLRKYFRHRLRPVVVKLRKAE